MITQINGNKTYNCSGTTADSIFFTNERNFMDGRMDVANNRQNTTLTPSNIMENIAKFTEKRLSILN